MNEFQPRLPRLGHVAHFQAIKQALRAGAAPESLPGWARSIWGGSDRERVHFVGPFVVKNAAGLQYYHDSETRYPFGPLPIRKAPTIRVKGPGDTFDSAYDIQLAYDVNHYKGARPNWQATPEYTGHMDRGSGNRYDLHPGNVELDRRGRWVAFDW